MVAFHSPPTPNTMIHDVEVCGFLGMGVEGGGVTGRAVSK